MINLVSPLKVDVLFNIVLFHKGDYAGTLNVYDLDVGNLSKPIFSQQAHASIINAIDGCGGPDNIGYGAPELGASYYNPSIYMKYVS